MSRLAKKPILIPKGTTVAVSNGVVSVKGPKGELSRTFRPIISIEATPESITLDIKSTSKEARALWGTYASHIKNMLAGANKPFVKKLIIEGIGYKADVKGADLVLSLGFSHQIIKPIPKGLTITSEKGLVTITGVDKEMVGSFASQVRALKKPEPYKGKGIRYENEIVKRKAGKRTTASA